MSVTSFSGPIKKLRESNLELLRIIAMLLVLIVHADNGSLGFPRPSDIANHPMSTFMRYFIEQLSLVCVNCFVLISGYFGIKQSWRGFGNFVFQIVFWFMLLFLIFSIIDPTYVVRQGGVDVLNPFNLWFITIYLGLFAVAPLLNTFIEHSYQKQYRNFLICYALLQFCFGWIEDLMHFNDGYSVWSFMFLYMLARYIRLYPSKLTTLPKHIDIAIYFGLALVISLTLMISVNYSIKFWQEFSKYTYGYNSPNVMIAGIFLFLFFTKLKFKSRAVNWVASSAFAIYLFHHNHLIFTRFYKNRILDYFKTDTTIMFILHIAVLLVSVFVIAVIVDKIRIYCWNKILYFIDLNKSQTNR